MEDSLGDAEEQVETKSPSCVLILVVMEDSLGGHTCQASQARQPQS